MIRSVLLIAFLVSLGLHSGQSVCFAQGVATEPALRESDIKTLADRLGRWRDLVHQYRQESRADRKLKLGRDRLNALASFRSTLEGIEKRTKVDLLKSTADLRAVLVAAQDFGRPRTRPGGFFQGEARQQDGGSRVTFRYGYYLPRKYPQESRRRAFPVIISLPVRRDTGNWYGGNTYLTNVYQNSPLLDDYILFCPELPNESDFSGSPASGVELFDWLDTMLFPLIEFLKSHNVDWNRIFLEGSKDSTRLALFFATAAPRYFAGLIVRDPLAMLGTSPHNFHNLPVLALASPATKPHAVAFKNAMDSLGYQNLTVLEPDEEAEDAFPFSSLTPKLVEWIEGQTRNPVPTRLVFRPIFSDFQNHWWVNIGQYAVHVEDARDNEAVRPVIEVTFDREQNRVKVKAKSIASFNLRLNDDLLDLDKPITLDVNGVLRELQVQRNLEWAISPVLDSDPQFITTYLLSDIAVPPEASSKPKEGSDDEGGPAPGR